MLPHLRNRFATGVLLALVAVLGQGCLVWRYPLTPDVAGYVMDAATTKPIAGATVTLRRKLTQSRKPAEVVRTTSTYGAFRLPALHAWAPCFLLPGDYWPSGMLVVAAPGYRVYEQPIQTFGGGKLRLPHPIDLEPEGSSPASLPPRPAPPRFTLPRTAPPDRALLYVFRPNNIPLIYKPTIVVNDVTVARLGSQEYIGLELPPGSYTIKEHWSWASSVPDNWLRLPVEPGQSYCLMLDTRVVVISSDPDYNKVTSRLELLRGDEGPAKMAPCRPAKKVLDVAGLIRPQ